MRHAEKKALLLDLPGDHQIVRVGDILSAVAEYLPDPNTDIIKRAYTFAARVHEGQARDSGEPYIVHPLEVTEILAQMQIDDTTLIAGLLHDMVEDTDITPEQIEKKFGADVLSLVEGVTKLSALEFRTRHDAQAENLRKMFMAMSSSAGWKRKSACPMPLLLDSAQRFQRHH